MGRRKIWNTTDFIGDLTAARIWRLKLAVSSDARLFGVGRQGTSIAAGLIRHQPVSALLYAIRYRL
jgi:hypothetical protein